MAQRADIQYIRHSYTHGTAARKLEVVEPKKAPLPVFEPLAQADPEQKISVSVDPLFIGSVVVAAVLVCLMVVSLFQFSAAHQQQVVLQEYVYQLSNEHAELEKTYQAGYDLAEIEAQALALGMIPAAEAQTMTIPGVVPAEDVQPTFWENVQQVFSELFAKANF